MKIRQGDILLVKVDKLPKGLVEKDKIVAYGESTGHTHRFESQAVCVFKDSKGQQYADLKQDAELIHEEHKNINVPKGKYLVVQQRELDILGEVRQVMD